MSAYSRSESMIATVATALGRELLKEVAFVDGCTTGLLLTDELSKQAVRYTDAGDLITHATGKPQWWEFQERLKVRGFQESTQDNMCTECVWEILKLILYR